MIPKSLFQRGFKQNISINVFYVSKEKYVDVYVMFKPHSENNLNIGNFEKPKSGNEETDEAIIEQSIETMLDDIYGDGEIFSRYIDDEDRARFLVHDRNLNFKFERMYEVQKNGK